MEDLKFKAPLYPLVPILGLVANCIVMGSLAFDPSQRLALYCGGAFFIGCYIVYYLKVKKVTNLKINQQEVQLKLEQKMYL
ncbi:Amino-acid permease RocE [compost metagenome]